jgi:hypothetical protein
MAMIYQSRLDDVPSAANEWEAGKRRPAFLSLKDLGIAPPAREERLFIANTV